MPPGTNGGVTITGLQAGALGAFILSATSTLLLPFCKDWTVTEKAKYTLALTAAGFSGTLLDSLLGALFQASVVDLHSGKIIEGTGGRKVLVHSSSPLKLKTRAKVRSEAVSYEEGKEGIAKTSGLGLDDASGIKASRKMQAAGGSGVEVADGQHESRKVEVGRDLLDNNAVNVLMAAMMSGGAMLVAAWLWEVPLSDVLR